jgi:hypothetical protein
MGQKNKTVPSLIVFALAIGCFLFWIKLGQSILLTNPEQLDQQRRVMLLYHSDYEALLEAGREVLRWDPRDPMKYRTIGPIHIDGFPVPRGVRIPKVIRKLRPHATLINFNGFVVIQMEGGFGDFGLRIYPEGFEAPDRRYFRYGSRLLIPGLWYYDREYEDRPGFHQRIDQIMQTGRWLEPNNPGLVERLNR